MLKVLYGFRMLPSGLYEIPQRKFAQKPTQAICDKKYGFFQQDVAFFKEVAQELGLLPNKNPLM